MSGANNQELFSEIAQLRLQLLTSETEKQDLLQKYESVKVRCVN